MIKDHRFLSFRAKIHLRLLGLWLAACFAEDFACCGWRSVARDLRVCLLVWFGRAVYLFAPSGKLATVPWDARPASM